MCPMSHPYDVLVQSVTRIHHIIEKKNLEGRISKGGFGEFLLAHALNHLLANGWKGPDAFGIGTDKAYEYKITLVDKINFNFGANQGNAEALITEWADARRGGIFSANYSPENKDFSRVIHTPAMSMKRRLVEDFERNNPRQLTASYSINRMATMEGSSEVRLTKRVEHHPYDDLVDEIQLAYAEANRLGIANRLAKGGVSEILLARELNHLCSTSAKGWDAKDIGQERFHEYKISETNQFNFDFGTRVDDIRALVERGYDGHEFCYVARRDGTKITTIMEIPILALSETIIAHFAKTTGKRLNMNYNWERLEEIEGTRVVR